MSPEDVAGLGRGDDGASLASYRGFSQSAYLQMLAFVVMCDTFSSCKKVQRRRGSP